MLPRQEELVRTLRGCLSTFIEEGYPLEEQIKCRSLLKDAFETYEDYLAYIKYATEYVKLDFSQPGAEQKISHLRPDFFKDISLKNRLDYGC